MGLAERRAVKEFEEKVSPEFKKQIETVAGFPILIDVKWDTLAVEGSAHLYKEAFPKVYFTPLINALKKVCVDDMGKEALKAGLKKVVIANTKGNYYGSGFTFEGGVLNLDHEPCSNIDNIDERSQAIQEILEKRL